jgi:hypothetical protein
MFNTLRSYFRTRRALLDTIAEQNRVHDELTASLIGARTGRDLESDRANAAEAQLDKVTAEANANLQRIESQAVTIARLSHSVEQHEAEIARLKAGQS